MALVTLKTTVITGCVGELIGDGSDVDELPDVPSPGYGGTITFTPLANEILLTAENPKRKLRVRPIVCQVDTNGYLLYNGLQRVTIPSSTNMGLVPGVGAFRSGWTWHVTYNVTRGGNNLVDFEPFDFIADEDDDLSLLTPVSSSPGTIVLKGDPGLPGGGPGGGVASVNSITPDATTGNLVLTQDGVPNGAAAVQFTNAMNTKLAGIEALANATTDAHVIALADTEIANATTVVKTTGAQTIAGVKTFSAAPVVPTNSFPVAAITGLDQHILDVVEAAYGRIVVARSYTGAAYEAEGINPTVEAFVWWSDVVNPTVTAPPVRSSDPDQQLWERR